MSLNDHHQSWLLTVSPSMIIYDLDGTLVDSLPDIVSVVNRVRTQLMLPTYDQQTITHWVGKGVSHLLVLAMADAPQRLEEATHIFYQCYEKISGCYSSVYAGVETFVRYAQLQGVLQAVVTNKPYRFAKHLLEVKGLNTYFSSVYGGDSFHERKPHPLPLLEAMKNESCLPEETIVIGDSVNDIQAARSAKVRSVGVTYGYNYGKSIQEAHPDWVVDDLRVLMPDSDVNFA